MHPLEKGCRRMPSPETNMLRRHSPCGRSWDVYNALLCREVLRVCKCQGLPYGVSLRLPLDTYFLAALLVKCLSAHCKCAKGCFLFAF